MSRSDPQFNLRMPQELKDYLEGEARKNKRSLTAEILDRLESSRPDILPIDDLITIDKDKIEQSARLNHQIALGFRKFQLEMEEHLLATQRILKEEFEKLKKNN